MAADEKVPNLKMAARTPTPAKELVMENMPRPKETKAERDRKLELGRRMLRDAAIRRRARARSAQGGAPKRERTESPAVIYQDGCRTEFSPSGRITRYSPGGRYTVYSPSGRHVGNFAPDGRKRFLHGTKNTDGLKAAKAVYQNAIASIQNSNRGAQQFEAFRANEDGSVNPENIKTMMNEADDVTDEHFRYLPNFFPDDDDDEVADIFGNGMPMGGMRAVFGRRAPTWNDRIVNQQEVMDAVREAYLTTGTMNRENDWLESMRVMRHLIESATHSNALDQNQISENWAFHQRHFNEWHGIWLARQNPPPPPNSPRSVIDPRINEMTGGAFRDDINFFATQITRFERSFNQLEVDHPLRSARLRLWRVTVEAFIGRVEQGIQDGDITRETAEPYYTFYNAHMDRLARIPPPIEDILAGPVSNIDEDEPGAEESKHEGGGIVPCRHEDIHGRQFAWQYNDRLASKVKHGLSALKYGRAADTVSFDESGHVLNRDGKQFGQTWKLKNNGRANIIDPETGERSEHPFIRMSGVNNSHTDVVCNDDGTQKWYNYSPAVGMRGVTDFEGSLVEGGKLSSEDFRELLKSSYSGDEVPGWQMDKDLSTDESKVYTKDGSKQVVVAHQGTTTASDWANNAVYALAGEAGYKKTPRYRRAKAVQKAAHSKYGAENISTIGHSQGGLQAQILGEKSNEIITLNKATRPFSNSKKDNQTDVRAIGDAVSYWDKNDKTIEADGNVLSKHSVDVVPDGEEYGKVDTIGGAIAQLEDLRPKINGKEKAKITRKINQLKKAHSESIRRAAARTAAGAIAKKMGSMSGGALANFVDPNWPANTRRNISQQLLDAYIQYVQNTPPQQLLVETLLLNQHPNLQDQLLELNAQAHVRSTLPPPAA